MIRRIWWLIVPAILAVLVFQLYWLGNIYTEQRRTLRSLVTDALQRAYDKTILETLEVGSLLNDSSDVSVDSASRRKASATIFKINQNHIKLNGDTNIWIGGQILKELGAKHGDLTFPLDTLKSHSSIEIFKGRPKDSHSRQGMETEIRIPFPQGKDSVISNSLTALTGKKYTGDTAAIDERSIVRFVAGILTTVMNIRPDTPNLHKNIREELPKAGIQLPFNTAFSSEPADSNAYDAGIRITGHDNEMLYIRFDSLSGYFIKKMSGPVAVSVLLLAIITGCTWMLSRIILKQKALETMRRDFISNMTHELKTPVTILHTINESLLTYNGMQDKERTERYLRLSKDELHKLQSHIEDILSLMKLEEGVPVLQKEVISLPETVSTVLSRFIHLPGVHISSDIPDTEMITNREALMTILSNLTDNAIKYSDKEAIAIHVTAGYNGNGYTFSIVDNGAGISAAHLPYIFDKFYRVPRGNLHDVKGYGLGLSHVKELIGKLGGSIQVNSTLGEGSTFTFQLPK